jgi:glutathione S-transferase
VEALEDASGLPLLLHWSPKSPFVRKVMIAARELGLDERLTLQRTVVRMSAPNQELMQQNPLGKIPTLVLPDGSILCDSIVICEYLDELAGGGRLFPRGEARWPALRLQAVANGLLDLLILWRNERDKPEEKQTAAWLDSFALKARTALDQFDAEAEVLAGRPFDIGQIALGCCLSYLDFRFPDLAWREGRDRLAAWHDTFRARPSAIATEVTDG